MNVIISRHYSIPLNKARSFVMRPNFLVFIASPLLRFPELEDPNFMKIWKPGTYTTSMKLFGLIPLGKQDINITIPHDEDSLFQVRDNGTGQLVKTWDHLITIQKITDEEIEYQDQVEVNAGLLTPAIWIFAQLFYRWRQYRWQIYIDTMDTTVSHQE